MAIVLFRSCKEKESFLCSAAVLQIKETWKMPKNTNKFKSCLKEQIRGELYKGLFALRTVYVIILYYLLF